DVVDVKDGTVPKTDTVYVTPPNTDVIMRDGALRLQQPSESLASPKPSVDRFFKSLAEEMRDRSVGIVLSGTGSDGAYGVQAIREVGGITIAQDDVSAKYDGMPTSAVETGCIDLVLRPRHIATHLQKILTGPRDFKGLRQLSEPDNPVASLLQVLLARTRVDFRDYKQSTILRRIERRMSALGIMDQEEYTSFCRSNPSEVDALFKDLLISVTRFFRDAEDFFDLRKVIEAMGADGRKRPYRIWVAGCATGEEAYSIAMLFAEAMGGIESVNKDMLQIFATDLDRTALQVARRGTYNTAAFDDVPPDIGNRYFLQAQAHSARVVEPLRNVILFSEHNLCQDPPFLDMDLICCRNVLIYFNSNLQSKVLARLHYALNAQGVLFLGKAESVIGSEDLFIDAATDAHIFRKRLLTNADNRAWRALSDNRRPPDITFPTRSDEPSVDRKMFDALARSVGAQSMLVSSDFQIIRVYGDVSEFVELTERSNLNLQLSILRSPFREEARSLVTLALKNNERRQGVRHLARDGANIEHRLLAVPVASEASDEKLVLVVFESLEVKGTPLVEGSNLDNVDGAVAVTRIQELENELLTTREALHQTIEQLETSNEELQSLNEEMQSTNEELQATNEERETSNEELQSTNEELITVNEELQINATELSALSSELTSILESVPSALIVVDTAMQITRASATAVAMFDLGMPLATPHLSQAATPEGFPRLTDICNETLQMGTTHRCEFESAGNQYTLLCAPFADEKGRIRGATVIIVASHSAL
ncbi:MAG: CheR family methyltransferase, partial [Pseudomonadota bacterium]